MTNINDPKTTPEYFNTSKAQKLNTNSPEPMTTNTSTITSLQNWLNITMADNLRAKRYINCYYTHFMNSAYRIYMNMTKNENQKTASFRAREKYYARV